MAKLTHLVKHHAQKCFKSRQLLALRTSIQSWRFETRRNKQIKLILAEHAQIRATGLKRNSMQAFKSTVAQQHKVTSLLNKFVHMRKTKVLRVLQSACKRSRTERALYVRVASQRLKTQCSLLFKNWSQLAYSRVSRRQDL
jgi:hypothetical protein